ncbi:hypothetical protein L0664_03175 [Octadecabacter sp. G9-8]|uniref:Uncharacterized protein n=1 Tax=Octadecabacter dasysiphoniae TaxID=2909341 RepID=A0ABS9CUG8_9RHOB|nr:hypothetical protein [Octadecabacter dasysiphoniae]MCF2870059.1 hypothetical protein [Octadecabacter dasysiphoniae]
MKHWIIAALLLASPAAAQDRMTPAQCTGSLSAVTAMADLPATLGTAQVDDEGWCRLSDVEVPIDDVSGLRIGHLRWRASDIARFIEGGLPPRTIDIEGVDFGMTARTGDPVFDYLLGLQMRQAQMSFGASLRWDGVQNAVTINNAYFEFDATNRIEATARIEGVNLSDMAAIQTSLGTAGLRSLTMKSQFDGWFETYVAMIVGNMVLAEGDGTPEAQVAARKRQAIEFMNDLPDSFMPTPSRSALAGFINGLPTPRGTAQLQISANPTIGAVRAARLAAIPRDADLAQLVEMALDGVTALFTWTPAGQAK